MGTASSAPRGVMASRAKALHTNSGAVSGSSRRWPTAVPMLDVLWYGAVCAVVPGRWLGSSHDDLYGRACLRFGSSMYDSALFDFVLRKLLNSKGLSTHDVDEANVSPNSYK